MAASFDVIGRLRVVGQAAFTGAMEGAATSLGHVDTQAKHADKSTTAATTSMGKGGSKLKGSIRSLGAWAGGAAAVYKGAQYLHGAVESTEELAKGTMALSRTTGMEAEQASAWVETVKVRGVDAASFQRGLVALSKQMEMARTGTKASAVMFKNLGVSMDAVKTGNTQDVMLQMADGMAKMKNPAQRAAYSQKLLGRQGQALLPLFASGSKAIQEQLDTAKKYGAVIGGEGVEHTKEFLQRQRELKMASDGLKVSLGESLMPAILAVAQALAQMASVMQPLLRSGTAVKIMLALLVTGLVTLKVAAIASTLATLSFNAALLLIPLAVVAVIALLILAYKRVGWFRSAVDATAHAVKVAAVWIAHAFVDAFHAVVSFATGSIRLIGKVISTVKSMPGKVWSAIQGLVTGYARFETSIGRTFLRLGKAIVTAIVAGVKAAPGKLLDAIKSLLPGGKVGQKIGSKLGLWASGGLVPSRQWGIVGEAGPELLQLPGGARITPLPQHAPGTAPSLGPSELGGARGHTTAHFYLDRRLVATAVAEDTADQKARRGR